MSNIEWTDETWNPVVGCSRASRGCDHCYAVTMSHRLETMGHERYAGLTVLNNRGERHFNGVVRCVPGVLDKPLKWREPRRVFVNSMGDLFHPKVPREFIDRVFGVMAVTPQHTYQVLTKRPEEMAAYFAELDLVDVIAGLRSQACKADPIACAVADHYSHDTLSTNGNTTIKPPGGPKLPWQWPLPNVWLGTSVEDQGAAELRIPHLLRCPAAVRFLSCEPLLGAVDLLRVDAAGFGGAAGHKIDVIRKGCWTEHYGFINHTNMHDEFGALHWVIVGGESGAGARPCDLAWIRGIVSQCREAGVACFVKQLGANPSATLAETGTDENDHDNIERLELRDRKGGDPDEWPENLRVREVPG